MHLRVIPRIFIPKEKADRTLAQVLLERYENFDIYWYYWPRDGFISIADYEPVIIVYSKKNELCCLAVRPGWDYKSNLVGNLHVPVEITFGGFPGGIFHHPFVHQLGLDNEFKKQRKGNIPVDYDVSAVKNRNQIPSFARTGLGHMTKPPWKRVMDPYEKAQRLYSDYRAGRLYQ